jgi:hypothetical protein
MGELPRSLVDSYSHLLYPQPRELGWSLSTPGDCYCVGFSHGMQEVQERVANLRLLRFRVWNSSFLQKMRRRVCKELQENTSRNQEAIRQGIRKEISSETMVHRVLGRSSKEGLRHSDDLQGALRNSSKDGKLFHLRRRNRLGSSETRVICITGAQPWTGWTMRK